MTMDSGDLYLKALSRFTSRDEPIISSLSLPPIPSTFPHSKLIPGTRFLVDAFRHAGDYSISYFLSHFHSDHYGGLSSKWSRGIVFCSPTTARLLTDVLGLSPLFVVPIPLGQPALIDGAQVILVDANRCPGAVQFLFTIPNDGTPSMSSRYVHTGDFRYSSSIKSDPCLSRFVGCTDAVFLDTTYCHPKFVFPSQQESVDYVSSVVERVEYDSKLKSVLFLVATYVIGKEKILLEIGRRCNRKVHVDARKMAVLRVLGYGESGVFTEDESESDVHVVGWNVLGETWPYFKDSCEIHLVPYSEHSNYDELREYVRFLKPKRVIPTVGSDVEKVDSKHASKMQKHFAGLIDEMVNKKEFLRGFHRGSGQAGAKVDNDAAENHTVERQYEEEEAMPSDMDSTGDISVGVGMESSSSLQESDSQTSVVLTDEQAQKIIEELCECLPSWVTREQMMDLIGSSGGDIVEAVTNFYDRFVSKELLLQVLYLYPRPVQFVLHPRPTKFVS